MSKKTEGQVLLQPVWEGKGAPGAARRSLAAGCGAEARARAGAAPPQSLLGGVTLDQLLCLSVSPAIKRRSRTENPCVPDLLCVHTEWRNWQQVKLWAEVSVITVFITTIFTIIATTITGFSTITVITTITVIITLTFLTTIIVFIIIFFITIITRKSCLVNTSYIPDRVKRFACFFSLTIHYFPAQFIAEETGSEKPNNPRSWNH